MGLIDLVKQKGTDVFKEGAAKFQDQVSNNMKTGLDQVSNNIKTGLDQVSNNIENGSAQSNPDPSPSVSVGLNGAVNAITQAEGEDEKLSGMIRAATIAINDILTDENKSTERAALADFVRKQIKEYEPPLLLAISKSLPVDESARTLFLENISKDMNSIKLGGGKAKSKKKLSRKRKQTKRKAMIKSRR